MPGLVGGKGVRNRYISVLSVPDPFRPRGGLPLPIGWVEGELEHHHDEALECQVLSVTRLEVDRARKTQPSVRRLGCYLRKSRLVIVLACSAFSAAGTCR